MGQVDALVVAGRNIHIQTKLLAFFQVRSRADKSTDPELGSLHIGQNRNKTPFFFFKLADVADPLLVFLMRPVAEVNPESIGAGVD